MGLDHWSDDLCRVVKTLKTRRNNLPHRGEHRKGGPQETKGNQLLLRLGKRFYISSLYSLTYYRIIEASIDE